MNKKEGVKEKLVRKTQNINIGILIMVLGIIFVVFAVQIRDLTQTDINYSVFGIVLLILGLILYIGTRKTTRRRR